MYSITLSYRGRGRATKREQGQLCSFGLLLAHNGPAAKQKREEGKQGEKKRRRKMSAEAQSQQELINSIIEKTIKA